MKIMAEQCMRRFSLRQNKRKQASVNMKDQEDPTRHVDIIIQEYLNINKINSQVDTNSISKESIGSRTN